MRLCRRGGLPRSSRFGMAARVRCGCLRTRSSEGRNYPAPRRGRGGEQDEAGALLEGQLPQVVQAMHLVVAATPAASHPPRGPTKRRTQDLGGVLQRHGSRTTYRAMMKDHLTPARWKRTPQPQLSHNSSCKHRQRGGRTRLNDQTSPRIRWPTLSSLPRARGRGDVDG